MNYKPTEVIANKYQIVKFIGKGATADVYLANDLSQEREVALKISKNDAKVTNNDKRFMQEAELLIKLNSENIVKGYEVFEWKNKVVIVMEYVDGESLEERLRRDKKFEPKNAAKHILQVINALETLHSAGTMHRDLKPSNLLITDEGDIKLMDFGIAQVSEDQGFTKEGNIIGTIGYMAPEVIRGNKANPLSEIYSLGVMTYKLLVGSLPFGKGKDIEVARRIISGGANPAHEINKKVSKEFSRVISKMMSLNPQERFRTLDEVKGKIQDYLNDNLEERNGFKIFKRK